MTLLYHSLYNRFVITNKPPANPVALCQQHQVDGVLVVNDAHVTIINADGSPGQLCVNGLRCVAAMLLSDKKSITLMMGGLEVPCSRQDDGNIAMQLPLAQQHRHPVTHDFTHAAFFTAPNPHLLVEEQLPADWPTSGANLSNDSRFAHGCNITFFQKDGDYVTAQVYERGVGVTPACGSAVLALASWLLNDGDEAVIAMPGGETVIQRAQNIITLVATASKLKMAGSSSRSIERATQDVNRDPGK